MVCTFAYKTISLLIVTHYQGPTNKMNGWFVLQLLILSMCYYQYVWIFVLKQRSQTCGLKAILQSGLGGACLFPSSKPHLCPPSPFPHPSWYPIPWGCSFGEHQGRWVWFRAAGMGVPAPHSPQIWELWGYSVSIHAPLSHGFCFHGESGETYHCCQPVPSPPGNPWICVLREWGAMGKRGEGRVVAGQGSV